MVVAQKRIKTSKGWRLPGEAVPEASEWSGQALNAALNSGLVSVSKSDFFKPSDGFECSECDRKFKTVKALNGHMRKHKS